jgi:hypothetical protein
MERTRHVPELLRPVGVADPDGAALDGGVQHGFRYVERFIQVLQNTSIDLELFQHFLGRFGKVRGQGDRRMNCHGEAGQGQGRTEKPRCTAGHRFLLWNERCRISLESFFLRCANAFLSIAEACLRAMVARVIILQLRPCRYIGIKMAALGQKRWWGSHALVFTRDQVDWALEQIGAVLGTCPPRLRRNPAHSAG